MSYPGFHVDLQHPTTQKPVRIMVWFEGLTTDDLRKYFPPQDLSLITKALAFPLQYANLPGDLRRNPLFLTENVFPKAGGIVQA